jgi:hypothetical protein
MAVFRRRRRWQNVRLCYARCWPGYWDVNGIEFAGLSERGDEPPQGKEFNSPKMSVNSIRHAESTGSKNVYYLFFLFDCRSCSLAKSCFHYLNRRVLCDFSLSFQEDGRGGGVSLLLSNKLRSFRFRIIFKFQFPVVYRWTLFALFSRRSVVTYTENVYHH